MAVIQNMKGGGMMKKIVCAVLCVLMLWGCAASKPVETTPNQTEPDQEPIGATIPLNITEPVTGASQDLGETGCVRIGYTNNVSRVLYVTKASDLAAYPELNQYDDAYFAHHALVVVLESTSSGSVKVGIESISDGVVTLSHEMPGNVGTTDMATWLLWAEVEQGLEETWSVANPALKSDSSAY